MFKRAMYMKNLCLSLVILGFVAACASTPPSETITQAPDNDIMLTEVNESPERFFQSFVRWGGRIVKSEKINETLRLEVLNYSLDQQGKPLQASTSSGGRFIAEILPPYKSIRYYRGRWLTVSGRLSGVESYSLVSGEEQKLPVVQVSDHYAWREEQRYYDDGYYDPWWPYFYFRYGIGHRKGKAGVGIFFNPLYPSILPR